jgi:hypothetical protein
MSRRISILLLTIVAVGVFFPARGQEWTGPYQLSVDSTADINPSSCREWVDGEWSCLVWQTNRSGNWDIHARTCWLYRGSRWEPERTVCADSVDEVHPVVACVRGEEPASFVCVWESRDSDEFGSVRASFSGGDTWREPVLVGLCAYGPGDSAEPTAIVIKDEEQDTVWVAWHTVSGLGHAIVYAFWAGDSWSETMVAHNDTAKERHVRIGRGVLAGVLYPLLVWEENGEVYCRRYLNHQWTEPEQVAPSPGYDRNPEVVSARTDFLRELGAWIVWESDRDGDSAVFWTWADSTTAAMRLCDTAGGNCRPVGTPAVFTTDDFWAVAVWESDRNGNADIYSRLMGRPDVWVNRDSSRDERPSLTALGWEGVIQLWACWQSDRTGNWDIFASYYYGSGLAGRGPWRPEISRIPGSRIVSGSLLIGAEARGALLDITGRKVTDLQPGENDIRHIAPGVYFVSRTETEDGRPRTAVRKVVIQR